jgi:hypothetical protein
VQIPPVMTKLLRDMVDDDDDDNDDGDAADD